MLAASRARTLAVAAIVAFGLLLAFRQLGSHGLYAGHGVYRAQVDALLHGRLALTERPEGLAHDLAWTPGGVQQVWGLGAPLWQLPFEAGARVLGAGPFPDRIALGLWLALMGFVLLRAFRPRAGEPWWLGAGSVVLTALLPALVTMLRGRLGVYEEAAAYAYGAAMLLLGGTLVLGRAPTRTRYLLLLAAAGATGLIRPTVWFYGLATAIIATASYVRGHGRRALPTVALGAALFVAGGAALYATNAARFGSGGEFGHRLNLHSLPGNVVATRFSYPFERAGWVEASVELIGGLFDQPERSRGRGFYRTGLHRGQSARARWREFYFTTYTWPYLPLVLVGLGLGARAWWRRRRTRDHGASDRGIDDAWLDRTLAAWAVLGAGPLVVFYLHAPSMSSRYQLDLGPAIAALLVIAWRAGARWAGARGRGVPALVALVALWALAIGTGRTRKRVALDPVDRATAARATAALRSPAAVARTFPAAYDLAAPELATWIASEAEPRPRGLYLNGIGWDLTTGRVPPALHLFVEGPRFLEVEVETVTGAAITPDAVRVAIGPVHLRQVAATPTTNGVRLRFEPPSPLAPGLEVAFVAFGPDAELDRAQTDFVLRRVRWRD